MSALILLDLDADQCGGESMNDCTSGTINVFNSSEEVVQGMCENLQCVCPPGYEWMLDICRGQSYKKYLHTQEI